MRMSKLPDSVHRAVCYIRKSREDEEAERRGEDTLAGQRHLMTSQVLPKYKLACDWAEEVASGDSIRDRPVFRQLLPQLGTLYQAILCKDLSRLGRGNYSDMGQVYDIIRERKIYIITTDQIYDPANFSDLRMIRFSLFFHREEYEMTVWRLTEGKYDGARRGKWVAGSVPYGYRYDPRTQTLKPDEAEAFVVRLIYALHVQEGLGLRAISNRLAQLGYRSPQGRAHWQPEVIRRILKNPAHKGTLLFRTTHRDKLNGRVIQRPVDEHIRLNHAFSGIVEEAVWDRAQAGLSTRDSRPPAPSGGIRSALAGIIHCSGCGKSLIRQSSTQLYRKQSGDISRYEKQFLSCLNCRYSVKYVDCEAQLEHVLEHLRDLDPAQLRERLTTVSSRQASDATAQTETRRQHLETRKQTASRRLRRARELLLDGAFDRTDFDVVRTQCIDDLRQVDTELASMELVSMEQSSNDFQENDGQTRHHPEAWDLHSLACVYRRLRHPGRKNQLLRALFRHVELELVSKGRGRRPSQFNLLVAVRDASLLGGDVAALPAAVDARDEHRVAKST